MSISDVLTKHADTFRQKTGVTHKLSIPEMTDLMASLKWGQFNLLEGTSNQYRNVNIDTASGEYWHTMTTASGGTTHMITDEMRNAGNVTYSATIENDSSYNVYIELYPIDKGNNRLDGGITGVIGIHPGDKDIKTTVTMSIKDNYYKLNADIYFYGVTKDQVVKVKDERLYLGTIPGIWVPSKSEMGEG